MNTTTNPLQVLRDAIAKSHELQSQIPALKQQKEALYNEANNLVSSGNIEDNTIIDRVSRARTKAGMIPHKIEQIQAQIEKLDRQFDALWTPVRLAAEEKLARVRVDIITELELSLAHLCGSQEKAREVATSIFSSTTIGARIHYIEKMRNFSVPGNAAEAEAQAQFAEDVNKIEQEWQAHLNSAPKAN